MMTKEARWVEDDWPFSSSTRIAHPQITVDQWGFDLDILEVGGEEGEDLGGGGVVVVVVGGGGGGGGEGVVVVVVVSYLLNAGSKTKISWIILIGHTTT